jgi:hypothetical protein
MELVAFVGNDKENWGQISALVKRGMWDKTILVRNKDVKDFPRLPRSEFLDIDSSKSLIDIKKELTDKLGKKLGKEFEVALSIASGNGKEHIALISSLLSIPVGVKFAVFTKTGIEFIN